MCGIAGTLLLDGSFPDPADLDRMNAAMAHRGPDDIGLHADGPVGLAFRRLAILDLSPEGHQPMLTPDGRHAIVFNGEIYNHRDLRGRLEAEGRAPANGWRSGTDTETLLHACVAWGVAAACRAANGMFALAWWDAPAGRLTLARDRFGKKPLFIVREPGRGLAFASELRALRAAWPLSGRLPAADRSRIAPFLCYRFSPGDETLLAGVEPIRPGHFIEVECGRGPQALDGLAQQGFYDFDFSPKASTASDAAAPIRDETEAVEGVHRLLAACRSEVASDFACLGQSCVAGWSWGGF